MATAAVTIRQATPSSTTKRNQGLNLSLTSGGKSQSGVAIPSTKPSQVGKPNLSLGTKITQRSGRRVDVAKPPGLPIPIQRPPVVTPLSTTLVTKSPELNRNTPLPGLIAVSPAPQPLIIPNPGQPPNPATSINSTSHCRV